MPLLFSFDPGVETGIALGQYGDDEPYERLAAWQKTGGLRGLMSFLDERVFDTIYDADVVCEKFVPLLGEFSPTLQTLEPLRIEGMLVERRFMPDYPSPQWQRASCQLIANTKSASDRILKEHGLWLTGSKLGRPNANDAISATKHALYYLKNTVRHGPTLDLYFGEE